MGGMTGRRFGHGPGATGEQRACQEGGTEAPGSARAAARGGAAVPRAASPWRGVVRGGGGADRPGLGGQCPSGGLGPKRKDERSPRAEGGTAGEAAGGRGAGDIREVRKLVESGVDVNSQNEVNGW